MELFADAQVVAFHMYACSAALSAEDQIHWDDVEGWLSEVLADEFHVDAQDGSPEQIGRLLCTLYDDVFRKRDFTGLHRMFRTQNEVARRQMEARRIGQAESERHEQLVRQQEDDDDDLSEGDEEGGEEEDGGAAGASSSSAGAGASAAAAEPVVEEEQKTAEQLQDEADGWEVAGSKGKKKGGKK
jgi:Mg-chelatase subunit ChlI